MAPPTPPTVTLSTLTARQRDVLRRLRFREVELPRPCYLADMPRGRYALIVPTLTSSYESGTHLDGATLRRLEALELIAYGQDAPLPNGVARGNLRRGCTVALTDQGRAVANAISCPHGRGWTQACRACREDEAARAGGDRDRMRAGA
jgi:hypothetical protein